jgi:hypothetical protein
MKRETPEEAALSLYPVNMVKLTETYEYDSNEVKRLAFCYGVKWQIEKFKNEPFVDYVDRHIVESVVELAKQHFVHSKEDTKQRAIAFHKWMKNNDTSENAERFFHYTDEDMFEVFIEEIYNKSK